MPYHNGYKIYFQAELQWAPPCSGQKNDGKMRRQLTAALIDSRSTEF